MTKRCRAKLPANLLGLRNRQDPSVQGHHQDPAVRGVFHLPLPWDVDGALLTARLCFALYRNDQILNLLRG